MEVLAASQPVPAWHAAGPNRPVGAWCAVDVWDSERVLFIDYDGPVPHTLMTHIGEVSRHGPRRPPRGAARDNHPTARAGRKKQ